MTQVVGAFLCRDGKVLLGLRAAYKRICPACWDAIGGHVEPGESLTEALARELREELDVAATEFSPLEVFLFGPPDEAEYTLYRVDGWQGEPRLANDEHDALAWFTPSEAAALPNLASDKYLPALAAMRP